MDTFTSVPSQLQMDIFTSVPLWCRHPGSLPVTDHDAFQMSFTGFSSTYYLSQFISGRVITLSHKIRKKKKKKKKEKFFIDYPWFQVSFFLGGLILKLRVWLIMSIIIVSIPGSNCI